MAGRPLAGNRMGTVRIGISGWRYAPWRGVFYPKGLVQRSELAYAAGTFRTIEINGTFYALQRPENFRNWQAETPDDFVFAVKAPRYITHIRRLKEAEKPLANFLASGVLRLGRKLGPILWQLPPNLPFDAERLDAFLGLLPRTSRQAADLAQNHEDRLAGRAWTETDAERPLRHALEVRHDSFRTPDFIRLLRRHGVALVVADAPDWPRLMDVTADFVYCRLHGAEELYASGYDSASLDRWADRVAAWAAGSEAEGDHAGLPAQRTAARDVYVYFDNDAKVHTPFDAQALTERLEARD